MNLEETIEKYWRAYNGHDLEAVLALVDEEVVIRFPTDPQPVRGKEQLRHRWSLLFTRIILDIREEILTTVVQGDMVACEVIESGTFTPPADMASAINSLSLHRPFRHHIGSFFRGNAQGLIAEIHSYWDTEAFSQQTGIAIKQVRSMQSRAN